MCDVPWPMWVYLGIGLPIAYWYQGRDTHPERDHHPRGQFLLLFVLACVWPILLLALLANAPDKPTRKDPPEK